MQVNADMKVSSIPWHALWNHSLHDTHCIQVRPFLSRASSQNLTWQMEHGIVSVESQLPVFLLLRVVLVAAVGLCFFMGLLVLALSLLSVRMSGLSRVNVRSLRATATDRFLLAGVDSSAVL